MGWWQGDNIHLTTMLSSKYRDVGAGVAEADGMVYYTLDVGYVAGEEGQPPVSQPGQDTRLPAGTPGADSAPAGTPVAWIVPVQASTPRPDGSIVHEVQFGQALYNIVDAYQIELPYLLTLNSLKADTVIYPGDKLWIRLPRPTPTLEASPTAELGATQTPARNPSSLQGKQTVPGTDPIQAVTPTRRAAPASSTPIAVAKAPAQQSAAEQPISDEAMGTKIPEQGGLDLVLVFIGVLIVLGTGLLLFGSLILTSRKL